VPASPGTGVNTLTGEGLTEALAGADVSNSPSFEDTAVEQPTLKPGSSHIRGDRPR